MKRLLLSILTVGLVSAGAFAATRAYFTDSVAVLGNTITTGTIKLLTNRTSEAIVLENLAPGWNYHDPSHWGYYTRKDIRVENDGTLPLKYRMRAVPTGGEYDDNLLDELLTSVNIDTGRGTIRAIFKGTLRDLLEWHEIESNFEPTGHSGWYGEGQNIRMGFALPYSAGNELQGQSIQFNLEFEATQVSNTGWSE